MATPHQCVVSTASIPPIGSIGSLTHSFCADLILSTGCKHKQTSSKSSRVRFVLRSLSLPRPRDENANVCSKLSLRQAPIKLVVIELTSSARTYSLFVASHWRGDGVVDCSAVALNRNITAPSRACCRVRFSSHSLFSSLLTSFHLSSPLYSCASVLVFIFHECTQATYQCMEERERERVQHSLNTTSTYGQCSLLLCYLA